MERIFFKTNYFQKMTINKFSMLSQEIILQEINKCGIITLNRPKVLNTLNFNMINLIYSTLKKWKSDTNITHVIVEGSGEKSFCAGSDIRQISEVAKTSRIEECKYFGNEYSMNYFIGTFGKPYISLIDGITMGAGFGLSFHGSHRVATEKTIFAMPETAIGLFPDVGSSYFLPRLPNNLGIYMGLTGTRLKGKDVLSINVANHFVHSQQIEKLKEELIRASNPSEIDNILSKYNESNKKHEFSLSPLLSLINEIFSKPSVESILDSLSEKARTSKSVAEKLWCADQINIIRKMSPSSLKITLRQLHEGRKWSFKECFVMEYRLYVRCLENKDFHEGVRAVIIDKDNKPKWDPPSIEEVSDEMVDTYFRPLVNDLVL